MILKHWASYLSYYDELSFVILRVLPKDLNREILRLLAQNDNRNMKPFKVFLWLLAFYCLHIIEGSFLPFFQIRGASPDLVFLMFFLFAFFHANEKKTIYGLAVFVGFLFDARISSSFFGAFIITFILLAYFLKKLKLIVQETNFASLAISFIAAFLIFKFIPWLTASLFISIQNKKIIFSGNFSFYNLLLTFSLNILFIFIYAIFCKKNAQRS